MRTTTSHRLHPRLFPGSFLLLFLLAALIGILVPATPVAAAPILQLTVALVPGTSVPIAAGQPFRMRLTYECSSSLAGDQCVNLQVTSVLPSALEELQIIGNSDVQLASYNPGTRTATWIFNSPLSLGTTGQLEFEARFLPGTTFDGTTTSVTATVSAQGAPPATSAPLNLTADASDQSTATKVVQSGGAVDDVTTYSINVCPGNIGALNLTNVTITDTLPLGAMYISSSPTATTVDTVASPQVVTWSGISGIDVPNCSSFRVTVRYPASDPLNVVGASKTNNSTVTGTPYGGVEKTMTPSVTHTLAVPNPGFSLDKTADSDTIVGATVNTQLRVHNTGNVQIDNVVVTDPIPAEQTVTRIDTGAAVAVAYQKNSNPTWITGVPLGNGVAVASFPGFGAGDYVSTLRFTLGTIPVAFDDSGIHIYSTIVNPPNGGGASYTLPHNVTNTATLHGEFGGVPLTDNTDGATTEVDVPKARPTPQKAIISGSPALPGDTVRYSLTLANGSFAPLDEPVIADLLPAQVTYTATSWTLTKNIPGCAATPTFSATPNYGGSGRTLLRWSWAGSGCSIPSGEDTHIEFNVKVNPGTYPTGAGSIPNWLALVDYSTDPLLVRRNNCASPAPAEVTIYTNGGYDLAKLCFSSPSGLGISAAASIGSAKYVRGQLDSVFHRDPQVGATVQGGLISYQMQLTNTGNVDFQNLLMVDVLPFDSPPPGNVGVRDLVPLGTAWTPQLAGPVVISPPVPGLTVRYSTERNPCRPNLAPSNPGCTPMVDGIAPGPGVWSLNLPSDPTAVRSLKFDFGNYVLRANETVQFTFPMFAPAAAPIASAGANGTLGDNDDTNVAWNTFAYEAVRADDGTRLVAQPPRVGIEVRPTPAGLASYGDYVWNDVNQDGAQDEPPYRGINGVTVHLYGDTDGNPATTGDQTLIGTQITHNDVGGNPGYYLFPALNPGYYFAEFVPPTGFSVTTPNAAVDIKDSDIDTVTFRSQITALVAGLDYRDTDAGFYAPVVSLGNRVWFDTNNDGIDNDGAGSALGSGAGVSGVTVQLFLDANGDGQLTGAEQSWIAEQTSDASGFYLFAEQTHSGGTALGSPVPLYPGQYIVGIAPNNFVPAGPLAGYYSSATTISNAGAIAEIAAPDSNNDTDRDDNGAMVRGATLFYNGGVLSTPVFVDDNEPTGEPESTGIAPGGLIITDNRSNLTLDFGFYTASLGNLVWVDDGVGGGTAVNGLRDGFEAGLSGVNVRLYSQNTTEIPVGPDGLLGTADDANGGMTTSVAGAYRFGNLLQGQYRVRVTVPANYASTRDTAGTANPDTNIDNDDNGPGTSTGAVTSNAITLTPGGAGAQNNNTVNAAAGSTHDSTVDFGIARYYSLGNRVWNDLNNNGLRDAGEPGINVVTVRLYSSDGVTIARRIDGTNVPNATTNASGYYRFDNLPAGDYIVEIRSANFTGAGALVGFRSSTGAAGAYEPAPDPDNDVDNDDNGTFAGTVARSQIVTLGEVSGTQEPTGDADGPAAGAEAPNNQSNRTVDFGFYAVLSLGNQVWKDANNNGIVDGGETGISGVTVNLYRDSNNDGTPDGAAIDTMPTNGTGHYLFTGLIADTYIVEIVLPAGYASSTGNFGGYEPAPDADTIPADNDDNGTAGAGVIRSAPVTLSVGSEPTGEGATPFLADDARDNNANYTVDFGLFQPLSLGNLVWLDADNNGVVNGGETGISGVIVRLYRDNNGDGNPDDLNGDTSITPADAIRTMTTSGTGHYLFTGLGVGDYIVEVVMPAGMSSSTGQAVPPPYEPAPDADSVPADDDDNGTLSGTVVHSAPITLSVGGEPTGEPATPGFSDSTPDNSSNLTVDFGFYMALSLGNQVWEDANNNGVVDGSETGFSGVIVRLYRDSNDDAMPDDADGNVTVDTNDAIRTTTTNGTGHYLFTELNAGTYIVEIVPPVGYRSSNGAANAYEPAPDADTIPADDDDNGTAGAGVIRSAPVTLTVGGEPAGELATPGLPDSTADNNANYTVDFGFFQPLGLGNLVFEDVANNGVYDSASDQPLAGATVTLFAADGTTPAVDVDGNPLASQTTAADGLYLFSNLAPGQYVVQVSAPSGYRSSSDLASTLTPDGDTDQDDNGEGGANVAASRSVTLTSHGEPATASDGDDTSGNLTVDFGFFQPLGLGNLVFEDVANNGVYDSASDQPLAGATVTLFAADGTTPAVDVDGNPLASQTTAADGLYLFSNLAPGQYIVQVSAPAGYRSSSDLASTLTPDNDTDQDDNGEGNANVAASRLVTLTSHGEPATASDGDDTSGNLTIDFGFFQPAALGDLVWLDENKDGVQDSGEPGIPGVTVSLYRPGPDGTAGTVDDVLVDSIVTGAGGTYLFDSLGVGDYFVQFALPLGYASSPQDTGGNGGVSDTTDSDTDTTTGRTAITTLTPGENDLTWDSGIYYTASLGDRVWLDQNANGIQDTGEPGVAGVIVTLYTSGGVQVGAPAPTDANGNYAFPNLPPGEYYVVFTAPIGYVISPPDQGTDDSADSDADTTTGSTATTTITLGEHDPNWDAGLYLPVSLGNLVWNDVNNNGVVDSGEAGIDGAVVNLYRDANGNGRIDAREFGATQTTSGGGQYLFAQLMPGSYLVQLAPSNFTGAGALAGYRSSTGGIGTNISATGPYEPAPGPNNDVNDDDNGSAVSGQGIVSAPVALTSGGEPTNDGDADANSNLTVDFGMFLPASLGSIVWYDTDKDGVRDSGEAGVAGVTVTLYDTTGNSIATTTTDSTGYYQFIDLPPGTYRVGFSNLPAGYTFTQPNQGGNDNNDSDADLATGLTSPITLVPGQNNPTLYAGIVPIIPTAITLMSFTATPEGDTIAVRWVTSAEFNTWGFYLYRSADGIRDHAIQITPELIPGRGRGQGASYAWDDATAEAGVTYNYWLQEVELNGNTNEYGPARVANGTAGVRYRIFLPLAVR